MPEQTKKDLQDRIDLLEKAIEPFTKIDCDAGRKDDFVLFTRETTITAGDVRRARKSMGITD